MPFEVGGSVGFERALVFDRNRPPAMTAIPLQAGLRFQLSRGFPLEPSNQRGEVSESGRLVLHWRWFSIFLPFT